MSDSNLNLPDDLFKQLLDESHDGVYFVDKVRIIRYWNKGSELITGYASAEVIGKPCYHDIMCHIDTEGRRTCEGRCPLDIALHAESTGIRRLYIRKKDGKRVPVDVRGTPIREKCTGEVIGAVEIFRDASVYEEAEKEAQLVVKLAGTDPLTGLLNRRQLEIEIEMEVNRARRLKLPVSVLFGDIDNFKLVNDTHGHAYGDRLLRETAKTLQSGVRPYDRISRFGGDEFVLLLPETQLHLGVEIADRLRREVAALNLAVLDNTKAAGHPAISFGLAELHGDETWEDLVNRADQALYKAKKSGRDTVFAAEPLPSNKSI
jgi:diguanylate cyclase (GGDEF)-like protein/PAS domain S-box-containing protein